MSTSGNDDDRAWADIVAGWQKESADPVPRWPVTEDVDEAGDTAGDKTPEPPPDVDAGWARQPTDEVVEDVELPSYDPAEQDHFVPPPPAPLPRPQKHTIAALVAIVVGLLLILKPGLIGLSGSDEVGFLGVAGLVGGVVTLVWKMRDAPPIDDGPDDGAVV